MEEELGLIGATAEDTEAELIRRICETELLSGKENPFLIFQYISKYFIIVEILHTINRNQHLFFFFPFSIGSEENLLSAFLPLLVKVCSSPGRYSHPQLTTAACLALSQYMMIK